MRIDTSTRHRPAMGETLFRLVRSTSEYSAPTGDVFATTGDTSCMTAGRLWSVLCCTQLRCKGGR